MKRATYRFLLILTLMAITLPVPTMLLLSQQNERPGVVVAAGTSHTFPADQSERGRPPENLDAKMSHLMMLIQGEQSVKARRAANVLGEMGHSVKPHLSALRDLQERPDEEVRAAIREAIEKIEAAIEREVEHLPRYEGR